MRNGQKHVENMFWTKKVFSPTKIFLDLKNFQKILTFRGQKSLSSGNRLKRVENKFRLEIRTFDLFLFFPRTWPIFSQNLWNELIFLDVHRLRTVLCLSVRNFVQSSTPSIVDRSWWNLYIIWGYYLVSPGEYSDPSTRGRGTPEKTCSLVVIFGSRHSSLTPRALPHAHVKISKMKLSLKPRISRELPLR